MAGLGRPDATVTMGDEAHLMMASWLVCRTGALLCAIPVEHVVEVMRGQPVEALAGAPGFVLGVSVIRGTPLVVVDVGLLLGGQTSETPWMVTVRVGDRVIALAVESVQGVHALETGTSVAMPPLLHNATTTAVDMLGTLDTELLLFLHFARCIPEALFDSLPSCAPDFKGGTP